MLFRLTNNGGSPAYNVKIQWEDELKDHKGKTVSFSEESITGIVSILRPGQSLSKVVDGHIQFFQIERNHVYRGSISFEDAHRRKLNHTFVLDAEMFKGTPLYEDESLKTHRELQEIPQRLKDVKRELELIRRGMQRDDGA